jgi:hypothetical protein
MDGQKSRQGKSNWNKNTMKDLKVEIKLSEQENGSIAWDCRHQDMVLYHGVIDFDGKKYLQHVGEYIPQIVIDDLKWKGYYGFPMDEKKESKKYKFKMVRKYETNLEVWAENEHEAEKMFQDVDMYEMELEQCNVVTEQIFTDHKRPLIEYNSEFGYYNREAENVLESQGFCIDGLWQVEDVTRYYPCSEKTAKEILKKILCSSELHGQIFDMLDKVCTDEYKLKHINEINNKIYE